MKKYLYILISFALIGCHQELKQVALTNPILDERINDVVEVSLDELGIEDFSNVILFNENNEEVPYQVNTDRVVFPVADIRGGMQVIYRFCKGKPSAIQPKVFCRYVPERKDDFAWENDLAAYRMYGPALAVEGSNNGVDLWLKNTEELVVDSFYYKDLTLGMPYHVNHGKGIDCYKVADKLGCGGISPMVNDSIIKGTVYKTWEILEEGPLQVRFKLTYEDHTLTISSTVGQPLNKAEVVYNTQDSLLAAGIFMHTQTSNDTIPVDGSIQFSESAGWAAFAENAVSDGGIPQGRNYCGIVMPGCNGVNINDATLSLRHSYQQGETLIYYFGGGWSEWKYPQDKDWFNAIATYATYINNPIKVEVL